MKEHQKVQRSQKSWPERYLEKDISVSVSHTHIDPYYTITVHIFLSTCSALF